MHQQSYIMNRCQVAEPQIIRNSHFVESLGCYVVTTFLFLNFPHSSFCLLIPKTVKCQTSSIVTWKYLSDQHISLALANFLLRHLGTGTARVPSPIIVKQVLYFGLIQYLDSVNLFFIRLHFDTDGQCFSFCPLYMYLDRDNHLWTILFPFSRRTSRGS